MINDKEEVGHASNDKIDKAADKLRELVDKAYERLDKWLIALSFSFIGIPALFAIGKIPYSSKVFLFISWLCFGIVVLVVLVRLLLEVILNKAALGKHENKETDREVHRGRFFCWCDTHERAIEVGSSIVSCAFFLVGVISALIAASVRVFCQ